MRCTPFERVYRHWLLLVVLWALALWVYYPGVSGPSLLDDRSSLGSLDILKGSQHYALDSIFGDKSGPLGRPVSMLTFVSEKLLSDGSVASSKRNNIILHLVTGGLVAWYFLLLASNLRPRGYRAAAVLCAAIWVLSPLQVSTVLYVVQRMAMLATFFTLLSLISYLYWRSSIGRGVLGILPCSLTIIFAVLAVLSKENGLVVIPLILLTEACWLQFRDQNSEEIVWLRRGVWILILFGGGLVVLLLALFWHWLGMAHLGRDFSLEERLLSQSRILWDYVGQFYISDLSRLGIYHDDYPVSRSLWEPVATFFAVMAWFSVAIMALALWRFSLGRILSFGCIFFLTAHSLESSVWPLELYFEHRNYLPSVGLALFPLACYLLVVNKYPEVAAPLLAWLGIYFVSLSFSTSSQVQIWSNANLLALQHVNGHPESARASRDLASRLAALGEKEGSLHYSRLAYHYALKHPAASDEHHGDYILRNVALACISGKPLVDSEFHALGSLNPNRPLGDVSTMSVMVKLRQGGICAEFDWEGFMNHLEGLYLQVFDTSLASAQMFSALATLANADQRWEDAYLYTSRFLALTPDNVRGMLMQLHFTTALDRREEADSLITQLQSLREAGKLSRSEQDTLALYLEN